MQLCDPRLNRGEGGWQESVKGIVRTIGRAGVQAVDLMSGLYIVEVPDFGDGA